MWFPPALLTAGRNGRHRFTTGGYDAVDTTTTKRRRPRSTIKTEDDTLRPGDRKRLIATTQDLRRNYAIAAWAIRKHLDYVSTFTFKAKTPDEGFSKAIEANLAEWGKRRNFDIARRHSLRRALRLAEAHRTVDGDYFLLKLASGKVQGIEGDRIRTPLRDLPGHLKPADFTHGIKCAKPGWAQLYALHNRRPGTGGYTFAKLIPARYVLDHGYYHRTDQVRGISPVASALNSFQDTYEAMDLAMAKLKVTQLFALAFYREAADPVGDIDPATPESTTPTTDAEDEARYKVDFGKGPVCLDLEDGDKADFLESKSPPIELQKFLEVIIGAALKSIDIPYSFYAENFSNYAGSRQALLQYEQSAENKRADNRDLLDLLTLWHLALEILDGRLVLPRGLDLAEVGWEWIARGLPWIQPLQETKADVEAIGARITSRHRICKRQGLDWSDIEDELETEEARIAARPGAQTNEPSPTQA